MVFHNDCFKEWHKISSEVFWLLFSLRWGPHSVQLTVLNRTVQWHLVHSPCVSLVSELFHPSRRRPCNHSPGLSPPFPWQPLTCSLSLWIYLFWISMVLIVNMYKFWNLYRHWFYSPFFLRKEIGRKRI